MVESGDGAGQFSVSGRPTNLITVGQGKAVFAVCAGVAVWLSLSLTLSLSLFDSLSLSLGGGLIKTETLSQRAVKSKTTNNQI